MKEVTFLLTPAEVNALLKLLNYIKFTCEDEEADIFKDSPFINSIFKKILKEYPIPLYQSKQRQKELLDSIEKRLEKKDYYNELIRRKKEIEKGNYTEHDLVEVD